MSFKLFLDKFEGKYSERAKEKAMCFYLTDTEPNRPAWLYIEEILVEIGFKEMIEVRRYPQPTKVEIEAIHKYIVDK